MRRALMKALKCKTLGAELAMDKYCTCSIYVDDHLPFMHIVQYNIIRAFYVDNHLPTLNARR